MEIESVWCLVGNMVRQRPFGPGGVDSVSGNRKFRGGAKIYLASLRHNYCFRENCWSELAIEVIGQHRDDRKWLTCFVRFEYTENWRLQLVYQPRILARLRHNQWPGFQLPYGTFDPGDSRNSQEHIEQFLSLLRKIDR